MEVKDIRQQQAQRVLWFNRYLWQRYSLIFFFFIDLYWAMFAIGSGAMSAILPVGLLVLGTLAVFEQFKLYYKHTNQLNWAKRAFIAQLVAFLFCGGTGFFEPLFTSVFPFMVYQSMTVQVLWVGAAILSGLCLLNLHGLKSISHNTDRFYQRMVASLKVD